MQRIPKALADIELEPGLPAYAQIEERVAREIVRGRLSPGERLPAEPQLANHLGVSRMTLRHALERLERRGLVTRRVGRGGGTFVSSPKVELDLTTFAGFSEQLRRLEMTAGAEVVSAAQRPAAPDVAAALGLSAGAPVYELVRIRSGDGDHLALEHSYLPAARYPGLLDFSLDGSLYDLLQQVYADRPREAVERLEALPAGLHEAKILGVKKGAPLFLVERIAYSKEGVPVEFARDLFRGDRARLVVWLPEYPAQAPLAGHLTRSKVAGRTKV